MKRLMIDELVKSPNLVTPAQAGVHKRLMKLDSRLRGNDKKDRNSTSYEAIKHEYVLVLKKDWENVIEKIYLDETRTNVRKLEMFDLNGLLLYRAEFIRMQNINGLLVPSRLFFSGANGDSFQLDINRYWADVSILPSTFVLTPAQ